MNFSDEYKFNLLGSHGRRYIRRGVVKHYHQNVLKGALSSVDYYYYYIRGLKVFSRCEDATKDRNTREHLVWTVEGTGSHARGVYSTQYTWRMETAKPRSKPYR